MAAEVAGDGVDGEREKRGEERREEGEYEKREKGERVKMGKWAVLGVYKPNSYGRPRQPLPCL